MNRIKRRMMCLLMACPLLAVGSCSLESWKLAVGPIFTGPKAMLGIELEFDNGVDFIVPLFSLGNNW